MVKCTIAFLVLFVTLNLSAQDKKKDNNSFGITFKGFVKSDLMFDSRQTVSAREGHFFLYPKPKKLDDYNKDINDKANLNMLSIQTRLTAVITAPEAFGAKPSAVVEGAFFGHTDPDINGFRLRHAFLKLAWTNSTLIIGQYWNPMFITEVYPGTVSFSTGVPFQPFARNPQLRFIHKISSIEFTLTAATQRDFASNGPSGSSSTYLRNSIIPIMDLNLKYKSPKFVAGVGVNLKSLTPRIETTKNFKTDEKITSFATMAFAKIVLDDFTFKIEGVYGENLNDLLMLGGYAVKTFDDSTEIETYTAYKTLSSWVDFSYGKKIKLGIFAGYTKNLGTNDIIAGDVYTRGEEIKAVLRISPRIIYKMATTQFAFEVDYTSAQYGLPDNKGKVQNTTTVSNLRLLIAAYLFF